MTISDPTGGPSCLHQKNCLLNILIFLFPPALLRMSYCWMLESAFTTSIWFPLSPWDSPFLKAIGQTRQHAARHDKFAPFPQRHLHHQVSGCWKQIVSSKMYCE